jgi:hypothetical protein
MNKSFACLNIEDKIKIILSAERGQQGHLRKNQPEDFVLPFGKLGTPSAMKQMTL